MRSTYMIIQRIHTTWTKASRGGDGAYRRERLPRCLPLPLECFTADFAIHRVDFSEFDDFRPVGSVAKGRSPSDLGICDLSLKVDDEGLVVQFIRDPRNAAGANRMDRDDSGNMVHMPHAFSLKDDEWGRLSYNGRYVDSDTGDWSYQQSIYNIGVFANVEVDRFEATRPAKQFAELAILR